MDSGISFITAIDPMPTHLLGIYPSAFSTTGSAGNFCWFGDGETAESSFEQRGASATPESWRDRRQVIKH